MRASERLSVRRRIRGFDWSVIIGALVIFIASLSYYLYSERDTREVYEMDCVLLISAVERDAWDDYGGEWISERDQLRTENGTTVLGEITEVAELPHMRSAVRNGVPSWEEHPYLIDLEVTVRMRLRGKSGDGLRVGDLRIAAGGRGNFRFGKLSAAAEILELREVVK